QHQKSFYGKFPGMGPESIFKFRAPSPPGGGAAHTTSRSAQKWSVLPSTNLVGDALYRASAKPERSGYLQDTLRNLLSHPAFGRAVDLRSAELHALGHGALELPLPVGESSSARIGRVAS